MDAGGLSRVGGDLNLSLLNSKGKNRPTHVDRGKRGKKNEERGTQKKSDYSHRVAKKEKVHTYHALFLPRKGGKISGVTTGP